MKHTKTVSVLVGLIGLLSLVSSLVGIIFSNGGESQVFQTVFGEAVEILGSGIYQNNSISVAAQGIANDYITLLIAIPALILSFIAYQRRTTQGLIALVGLMGYFLYTYTSYVFLWFYNPLFLVYVAIMSLSLFTFILLFSEFDANRIVTQFSEQLPIKSIVIYQVLVAVFLTLMWLSKLVPPLLMGTYPVELEHYTTMVIQALDLGIVVPVALISAIQLNKRKPIGYILTSVILVKGTMMLLAILAMMINMILAGVPENWMVFVVFVILAILSSRYLSIWMKGVSNYSYNRNEKR